jgi:hypothetical protein
MKKRGVISRYQSFVTSPHFFPVILIIILLLLTALKISGTSIGIYFSYLYGGEKDPHLLLNKPRPIRSDEWLVNTQMTIAQEKNGFERINQNFVGNKDMSLIVDVPYKEWSVIFKPQNLSFFILPFEHAFAFKWWFMLIALILGAYYFTLKLLPRQILLAIFVSLIISMSPFVFWWYQTITIGPLVYGFLILLLGMIIIDNKPLVLFKKKIQPVTASIIKMAALAYVVTCFALILYPPFQIPVALAVGFFLLGYMLQYSRKLTRKDWITILSTFLGAIVLTGAVCGTFLLTRSEAIHTITNTVYPGKRVVAAGGYDIKQLLVTYLQPQLQRNSRGNHYITNQSESSSFILMPLFFVIPSIALLIWLYIKKKRFEWVLFMIILCSLLFLANLFVPSPDIFAKLSLLYTVPHERLIIGLGFLTIINVVYLFKVYADNKIRFTKNRVVAAAAYSALFLAIMIWAGLEISKLYPDFVTNKLFIIGLACILAAGLFLILINRILYGLGIIVLLSFGSVAIIHPLYQGLGPIYNSEITSTIQKISNKESVWGAASDTFMENIPQMSGHMAVTGVSAYPSNDFWKQYTKAGSDTIYNRYAHILLSPDDTTSLTLAAPDRFFISDSCAEKISQKIDYIVSTTPMTDQCIQLLKTIKYPSLTVYFYRQ